MKGFPTSAEEFERERKAAVSVDSADLFKAICDNPVVKAVLVELRHTCYYGIAERGAGEEPITFGGYEKFSEIRQTADFAFDNQLGVRAVRILDAMGALVWERVKDA